MKDHKIILGTPRSGSNFVTKWYANEYPEYTPLSPNQGHEHFEPDHPGWPNLDDAKGIDKETQLRIDALENKTLWKVLAGPYMSELIFDYISNMPVVLVKRKDLLGQFLSYGIGITTNKWVNYDKTIKSNNGLTSNQTFYYKKEWFDEMVYRLKDLEKRQKTLNIEKLIWFEDISNFKINGKLPIRQNDFSNETKLNWLTNSNEFMDWFSTFTNSFVLQE